MTAIRGAWVGLLFTLLLSGCATYSGVTYYYDDGVSVGGDYSYAEPAADPGAAPLVWSPVWARYYSTILYPPYWRSYDPWYTPTWYYGYYYPPRAGWRYGWNVYAYDPWWGGSWYSPYRYGGHGSFAYSWYGYDSHHTWRDYERRYGRRGYESWRRSGDDRRASDEVARITRPYGGQPGLQASAPRAGLPYRGEPSAYDRRDDRAAPAGRPSRFGNPEAAPPRAPDRGSSSNEARLIGTRESGWIAPVDGDSLPSRRTTIPPGDVGLPPQRDGGERASGLLDDGGNSSAAPSRRAVGAGGRGAWPTTTPAAEPVRFAAPAASETARSGTRWSRFEDEEPTAPGAFERSQDNLRGRYPSPARGDGPRFEAQARDESPRFSPPQREESPRFEIPERGESPRFELPGRDDSPRFDPPQHDHALDRGGSSRQLERIVREDE